MTDERVASQSFFRSLLARPEFGALAGVVLVFLVFGVTAHDKGMFTSDGIVSWLEASAQLGILAVGACLLMIAGEFDLSLGSMIGFAGMVLAVALKVWGLPPAAALGLSFAAAIAVGFCNGLLVVRTGLPSFIVTLASLFILRGATLIISRSQTQQTLIGGLKKKTDGSLVASLFGGDLWGLPAVVIWWLVVTAIAAWVLSRTRFGNWIFAAGGDAAAARSVGVPTARVKVTLFVVAAACAALFAACQVFDAGSADTQRGLGKEFHAIIAAVIGGTLLTGGYGSVIGASLGALIFGVVQMGIFFTGSDPDWFRVFLGAMLLGAVALNDVVRKLALGSRS